MWECFKNAFNMKFILLKQSAVRYSMLQPRQDITKYYFSYSVWCDEYELCQTNYQPANQTNGQPTSQHCNAKYCSCFLGPSLTCHFMHPNPKCWAHANIRSTTSPTSKHDREIFHENATKNNKPKALHNKLMLFTKIPLCFPHIEHIAYTWTKRRFCTIYG